MTNNRWMLLPSEKDKRQLLEEIIEDDGITASDLRQLLEIHKSAKASTSDAAHEAAADYSDASVAEDDATANKNEEVADEDLIALDYECATLQRTPFTISSSGEDDTIASTSHAPVTGDIVVPRVSKGETIARYLTSRTEETNPFASELLEHSHQVDMFVTCSETMLTHLLKFLDSAEVADRDIVDKHFAQERTEIEKLLEQRSNLSVIDGEEFDAVTMSEPTTAASTTNGGGGGSADGAHTLPSTDVTQLCDNIAFGDDGVDEDDDLIVQKLLLEQQHEREASEVAVNTIETSPSIVELLVNEHDGQDSYDDSTIRPADFAAAKLLEGMRVEEATGQIEDSNSPPDNGGIVSADAVDDGE